MSCVRIVRVVGKVAAPHLGQAGGVVVSGSGMGGSLSPPAANRHGHPTANDACMRPTSRRTTGATWVPNSSIERIRSRCGGLPTPM